MINKKHTIIKLITCALLISGTAYADEQYDEHGDLINTREAVEAFKDGEPLALSRTEFRVLQELIQEGGRVLSRDELLRRVWGYGNAGDGRVVDNLIYRLRAKLEVDAAKPEHLVTVRGFGYRLKP